jgi:hypothetical protein
MGRPQHEGLVRITVCKKLLIDAPVGDLKRAVCSTFPYTCCVKRTVSLIVSVFCKRFSLDDI